MTAQSFDETFSRAFDMSSPRLATLAGSLALLACGNGGSGSPSGTADVAAEREAKKTLAAMSFTEAPPPPPDASNAVADSSLAARFGQRLFFDPGFSGELMSGDNDGSANALGQRGDTGKVACAGCHVPAGGFSDTRSVRQQVSLGAGWGLRRAPSLLDVAQSSLLMWDGHKDSLFSQPIGVIENAVEMNSSRLYAAEHVFETLRDEYESVFGAMPPLDDATRFPPLGATETGCRKLDGEIKCNGPIRGAPGDGAEFDGMQREDQEAVTRIVANIGKALGAYERLLACGPSRFDAWIAGDDGALSASEQRGALLFAGKAQCASCHSGPFFSDETFHNVGLKPAVVATTFIDADDHGASVGFDLLSSDPLNVQGIYSDGDDGRDAPVAEGGVDGGFRTPKLRCSSSRPSFMHTAQLRKLADVVAFFDRGGDIGGFPGTNEIQPLNLTDDERADLVAFLQALDGPGPAANLLTPPD